MSELTAKTTGMNQTHSKVTGDHSDLVQIVSRLDRQLGDLFGQWEGQAAQSARAMAAGWRTQMRAHLDILESAATELSRAADRFDEVDRRAARRWSW